MSEEKVSLGKNPSPQQQQKKHAADMLLAAGGGGVDIAVPVVSVEIPSGGAIYPVDSSLHGKSSIDIKSMTAKEEDILTSGPLLRQGKAMSTLLKSCIIDKSINPEDLLVGDRNAILIAIRVSGYGAEYGAKIECRECGDQFDHEFSLAKIPVRSLEASPIEEGRNLFYFELPVLKKQVAFKLLTGAEERELTQLQDRTRKALGVGAPENNVTMRLLHQVVSVDGETDRQLLARLIRKMPARDSLELRKYIDKISPGVDLKEFVTCASCGEETEVDVPFGADFFWPEL